MSTIASKALATLRVLIVEDSEDDAALLAQVLRRGAWTVTYERVETPAAMSAALDRRGWDLIIADYSLPRFSGPAALALALERASDLPFILTSGVVSEETAVQAMKAGADDYFSKGNYARLLPAVERELHTAQARREARLIEQELRKRESHLDGALQLARIGTWHLDIATNTAVWSDEACRIVGFNPECTGPTLDEFLTRLHADDRKLLTRLLHNPATKQFAQDLQMIRADGAPQFVNLRGDIVRDSELVPIESAGTIQDITERKLAEAEVERAHLLLTAQNTRLLELTKQAHRFVDDVSHEFRTPLTVIKEFGAIIADGLAGPLTDEQGQYLGIIDNAVLDLNQMVEDFLDSSKLRAGRLRVDRRPQAIEKIFARIRPGLLKKAASRSIVVVEHIDVDLPLAFADEEKVRRVIMNLATNAIKFSPEHSQIELWARPAQEGGVEIGVTDQGPGLAADDLHQLFERFTQLPSAGAPSLKGFGLGLNIARQLVWLNLGKMNVVSAPNEGSTFSFTLPANDSRMIVERFFTRLAECGEVAPSVAAISVTTENPAESLDSLRSFLAATTRPIDVILDVHYGTEHGLLVLGPTGSVEGWVARLSKARERARGEAPELGRLHFAVLGTFDYPDGTPAAATCALDHLARELVVAPTIAPESTDSAPELVLAVEGPIHDGPTSA
jgi:PAS domain S-box-containing protein